MSQGEREACILLVEDSPPDAAVARYALTAAGGGSVEHYSTLGDALERLGDAARPIPTAVLLHLSLPESSGIEAFDRLAAFGPTPVVLLTGEDDPSRALALIERGAQDQLVKGSNSGDAIARSVRQAVERSRQHEDQRKAREQVETAVHAQRAFIAAMSHEVRTPLHAILGMSDLLAQTPLEADQREYVEISRRCGRALKGLLDNALELLRLESGGIELAREPFELEAVVQECLESFAFAADQKGIGLLGDVADDAIGTAVGDPGRLRQVLFNLVGNAVKFTESGRVVVSVRSTDAGGVAIEVADTGIGIRRDRQTAVFERFVQAESVTTRRYGGSGLGLALCRELVTAMGGEIGIESERGKGSVFRFALPLHVEARESLPSLAAQRILVALADPVESDLLVSRMQRRGASVHRARTSAELERLLRSNLRFDALLLDFRMPESGALDLFERLELAGCVSARRVVLLPLKHRAGDLARCTALGAVGLYKPARWENVVCALRGGRVDSAAPHEDSAPSFEGRRILLAEDAPENRIIALTHLRKAGCSVEVAVDGEEAVEKHRLGHFDLILMDVHMPGVDGCQATRRIRASERQAGRIATPIVALTADALPEQKAECEAAGCDAHLGKPFTRHDLYSVLRRFLPAPEIPVSTRLASAPEATEQGVRLESRPTRSEPEASEGGRLQWLAQIPPDVADLAEEYLGNRRADAETLRAATERGDFAEARRLGHNMKGSGAGYGFPRVTQLGAQIEQAADRKDAAEIDQLAGALSEYAEKRLETLAESTRGAGG